MLMPPLINRWNELKDEDKALFPLLEVRHLRGDPLNNPLTHMRLSEGGGGAECVGR